MDKLEKMRADLRQCVADMKATNEKTEFTAEDQTQFDTLKAKAEGLKKQIANAEEYQKWQAEAPAVTTAEAAVSTDIKVGKERFEDDPKKGFKSHRDFLSMVLGCARLAHAKDASDPRMKYLAVEGRPGFNATAGSDEHSTFSDSYGGFLVPEAFSPGMMATGVPDDPVGPRTTKVPMQYPILNIGSRVDKDHRTSVSGGLMVYRRAEADTVSPSRMQTEAIKMEATALFGLSYATEELLERSPISFVALLDQGFRTQFTYRLLKERINGTGAGQFMGIYNSPSLITIAKEQGQAAKTVCTENVLKMAARTWGYGNAVWMANQTLRTQLPLLHIAIGTAGVPLYVPSQQDGFPDMLWGRPIIYHEVMPTLGTAGDLACVNWAEYLEGTLSPLRSAESVHVRFLNHERTFKFWVENAGMPWWRETLKPENGDELSPFVRLGAR